MLVVGVCVRASRKRGHMGGGTRGMQPDCIWGRLTFFLVSILMNSLTQTHFLSLYQNFTGVVWMEALKVQVRYGIIKREYSKRAIENIIRG